MNKFSRFHSLLGTVISLSLLSGCSQPEHLKTKANLAQWMQQRVAKDVCFDESIKECVLGEQIKTDEQDCIKALKAYQASCQLNSFPTMQGPVSDRDLNQYPVYQGCIAAEYLHAKHIEDSATGACQKIYQNALNAAGRK